MLNRHTEKLIKSGTFGPETDTENNVVWLTYFGRHGKEIICLYSSLLLS